MTTMKKMRMTTTEMTMLKNRRLEDEEEGQELRSSCSFVYAFVLEANPRVLGLLAEAVGCLKMGWQCLASCSQ